MDLTHILKSIIGIMVVLIIVIIAVIPIFSDLQTSTEIMMVDGDGVAVDVSSSTVTFDNLTSDIVIDGEMHDSLGERNDTKLLVVSEKFTLIYQSKIYVYYESAPNITYSLSDVEIENGTLLIEDEVVLESTWCYAIIQGEVGEYSVLHKYQSGWDAAIQIGPIQYDGADSMFIGFGGSGVRICHTYSIDSDGIVTDMWGRGELITTSTVNRYDGYSDITVNSSFDAAGLDGWLLVDPEYTVTVTNEDSTFKMIGLLPVIMIASVMIATIGLFLSSKSE